MEVLLVWLWWLMQLLMRLRLVGLMKSAAHACHCCHCTCSIVLVLLLVLLVLLVLVLHAGLWLVVVFLGVDERDAESDEFAPELLVVSEDQARDRGVQRCRHDERHFSLTTEQCHTHHCSC